MKKSKALILLLCVTIVGMLAFSSVFIAHEADHECSDMHCSICADLQLYRSFAKTLSCCALMAAMGLFAPDGFKDTGSFFSITFPTITPVSLKVKLLN